MFDMKEMKSFLASESAGLGGGIASWHSLIDMTGVVITVSTPELFREGLSNNICMFQSKANIHTISVHCMESIIMKRETCWRKVLRIDKSFGRQKVQQV